MCPPHASYKRPGVSVLTTIRDRADRDELPGFLEATLPWAEEIVVSFAGVPAAAGLRHERVRFLETNLSAWGADARVDRQLQAVALLAEHEWSLALPVHARLQADDAERIRRELPTLGPSTLSFRLPGEAREYATYYRQSVWRTDWQLRPCLTGDLVGQADGERSLRGTLVLDDVRESAPDRSIRRLARAVPTPTGERHHAIVTGMLQSGLTPLIRLLATLGLAPGDELLTDARQEESLWIDRPAQLANIQAIRQATGMAVPWAWCAASRVIPSMLSEASLELVRSAAARARSGGPCVWKSPLFALTLAVWRRQLPDMTCVVPIRNPIEIADALARSFEIPAVDAVRIWYRQHRILLTTLSDHEIPSLFVDFERMFHNPAREAGRVARAFGLDETSSTQWFEPQRRSRRAEGDFRTQLGELFGGQVLAGEIEQIVEMYETLQEAASDTFATKTPPTQSAHRRASVVLHHDDAGDLAACLSNLGAQANDVAEVLLLDTTSTANDPAPPGLPFPVSRIDARSNPADALGHLEPTSGILLFSRTDVRLGSGTVAAHVRSHEAASRRIVVGQVSGGGPGTPDDRALLARDVIGGFDSLLPEPYPANSSLPTAVLSAIGFDASLEAGFEFVDLAIRARAAGYESITLDAAASYQEPMSALRSATRQRAAGRALGGFADRQPTYFPRKLLRERALASMPLLPQHGEMLEHITRLQEAVRSGMAFDAGALRQIDATTSQVATISSVLGLTRSDPRVIRLLGWDVWAQLCAIQGERWSDPSDAEYEERVAENQERCAELEGAQAGATVFVCGTGPQLAELDERQRSALRRRVVIGVNDAPYGVHTHYLLSAYFNRIALARRHLDPSAHVIHMRPFVAPPLLDNTICVRRDLFDGSLPSKLGSPPTLRTFTNVALGATHLALILGARRVVYVGMELSTRLHFYSDDPELRRTLVQDFDRLKNEKFFGVDHPYERHTHIRQEVYGKDAEVLRSYPNPFAPYDTAAMFSRYFRALAARNVDVYTTLEDGVLQGAGATFASLDELLLEESGRTPLPQGIGAAP